MSLSTSILNSDDKDWVQGRLLSELQRLNARIDELDLNTLKKSANLTDLPDGAQAFENIIYSYDGEQQPLQTLVQKYQSPAASGGSTVKAIFRAAISGAGTGNVYTSASLYALYNDGGSFSGDYRRPSEDGNYLVRFSVTQTVPAVTTAGTYVGSLIQKEGAAMQSISSGVCGMTYREQADSAGNYPSGASGTSYSVRRANNQITVVDLAYLSLTTTAGVRFGCSHANVNTDIVCTEIIKV